MDSLIRDITFGCRLLWKDRGFALTAILTLAISIGANVAVFTIVESVVLRPLPLPEADRIMLMSNRYPNAGAGDSNYSGTVDYYDRLEALDVYEEQAIFGFSGATIEIGNVAERVSTGRATPSLFRLLGVNTALGRAFFEEDSEVGQHHKVILTAGLWQQLFGGDPSAVGRDLRIGGEPYEIVGVLPPDFLFIDPDVRFWTPLAFSPEDRSDDNRHSNNWHNIGRLKPGATIDQAREQIAALNTSLDERFPQFKELLANAGFYTSVEPLQDMLVRDIRPTLFMLWAGAAFVLLIGAVNIANLALARASLRMKEFATRLALGAARMRIVRQLVTESVIVALAGGLAGLAIGGVILQVLSGIGLDQIPRAGEVRMDVFVIGFTLVVSVAAGLLIGAMPLGQILGSDIGRVMNEEGRSGTGGRTRRTLRRSLVVAQVGLAFILLIGAGLLLASFRELLSVDPGFEPTNVVTASFSPPTSSYPDGEILRAFTARALETIRAIPGVLEAGTTNSVPFDGNYGDAVILAEGYQMQPGESLVSPRRLRVTPGYFETMGMPLVAGRYFAEGDGPDAPGVVIVDERLADKFWPGDDPGGRRMYRPTDPNDLLAVNEDTVWLTVVGVVREAVLEDLAGNDESVGAYYFPFGQDTGRTSRFVIKTASDPSGLIPSVRTAVAAIDPELPLYDVRTMGERLDLSLTSQRTAMVLALAFAGVALLISADGIYGVLAFLVSQRTREIGIRMALGSSGRSVFSLVLREGMLLVGFGLALGIAGTVALRGALANQVYGVGPLDLSVIGLVIAVLGLVALSACALPARRAARVDPVIVLTEQ